MQVMAVRGGEGDELEAVEPPLAVIITQCVHLRSAFASLDGQGQPFHL